MNSEREQLQALITDIDGVLRKMSSRMAWWMSGDTRQILERVRNFLLKLEQKNQVMAASSVSLSPESSARGSMMTATDTNVPSAMTGQDPVIGAWQALVGEMNTLRTQVMQPMAAELKMLQEQRESLLKEIQELERRRQHNYSLAQQQANQQKIISEFLQVLMGRLQESLTKSVTQFLANIESQGLVYGSNTGRDKGTLPGDISSSTGLVLLDPQERLEHLRMLQAQSDQLLISLDQNLRVIFEAVQRNVHAYQDSLLQELEKMHRLGQQNETILSQLVYQLTQQLGQASSSTYLQSSLNLTKQVTEKQASEQPREKLTTENLPQSLLSPNKPEIFSELIATTPSFSEQKTDNLTTNIQNQETSEDINRPDIDDNNVDGNLDFNADEIKFTEPAAETPEPPVRSLENISELIGEMDLSESAAESLPSDTFLALNEPDNELFAPEETLLGIKDPLISEAPIELPINTKIIQQLSEDLLNLEILENEENNQNLDAAENWGWGEADRYDITSSPDREYLEALVSNNEVATPLTATAPVQTATAPTTAPTDEEEDIFAGFIAPEPPSTSSKPVSPAPVPVATAPTTAPTDEEEDIFAGFIAPEPPSTSSKPVSPAPVPVATAPTTAPTDEEEDIFAGFIAPEPPSTSSQPVSPAPVPVATAPTTAPTDEEEDIFAGFIAPEPPSTSSQPVSPVPVPVAASTPTVTEPKDEDEDIFAGFIASEPPSTSSQPVSSAPVPVATSTPTATETTDKDEDEDIFAGFIAPEPPSTSSQPVSPVPVPVAASTPTATESKDKDEDEDLFAGFISPKPRVKPQDPIKPVPTKNISPKKTNTDILPQAEEKIQGLSSRLDTTPESETKKLTLDEIFAELIAASPAPEISSDAENWVEIKPFNPTTSQVQEQKPEPTDEINSSIDDFFAGFDSSGETVPDQLAIAPNSEDLPDDLPDIDQWIANEALSELAIVSDHTSNSDLDDFFAELSDSPSRSTRENSTSVISIPTDEDLFG